MATLKDIAIKTGLSIPTVSRILHSKKGRFGHNKATIELVEKVALELNYSPNAVAKSLVTNKTNNICFVLDSLRDSPEEGAFWSRIMSGIVKGASQLGMNCLTTIENYSDVEHFKVPTGILGRQVDGFIITHPLGMMDLKVLERFIEFGLPFVVLSMPLDDSRIYSVWCDSAQGYEKAVTRLGELGHTQIGYCRYPQWHAKESKSAWLPLEPKKYNNMSFVPVEVDLTIRSQKEEGYRIAEAIASGKIKVSAIIMGDIISVYMMDRLKQLGVHVPEDLSVVGLDDTFVCQLCCPKLSSLHAPLELMGKTAVTLLRDSINLSKNPNSKPIVKHIPLAKTFVERESIAPYSPRKSSVLTTASK